MTSSNSETRPASVERRTLLRGVFATGAALTLAGCGMGGGSSSQKGGKPIAPKLDGDLVFFNWGTYIDPDLLTDFGDEHGVKVREANFASMDDMITKIRSGNAYDVIFPSSKWASRLIEEDMLAKLDHDAMENFGQISGPFTYFEDPWYDAGSAHTAPYTMYYSGLMFRDDKPAKLTGSWDDLWSDSARNHIYDLDDRDEVLAMAALRNGFDVNTSEPAELKVIKKDLLDQRKYLRGYSSDPFTYLESGSAWIQHAWNGNIVTLQNQVTDPETYKFQRCEEGTPITTDAMAIPVNAEHPGTAATFIDWMLKPENAARNMEFLGFSMPNAGAVPAYEKMIKNNPGIGLTVEDLADDRMLFKDPGVDGDRRRQEVWTAVRAQ